MSLARECVPYHRASLWLTMCLLAPKSISITSPLTHIQNKCKEAPERCSHKFCSRTPWEVEGLSLGAGGWGSRNKFPEGLVSSPVNGIRVPAHRAGKVSKRKAFTSMPGEQ